jgi:hypothetical protein
MKRIIFGLMFLVFFSTFCFAIATVIDFSVTSVKMPVFTYNSTFSSADRSAECYLAGMNNGAGGVTIQVVKGGSAMAFRGDANIITSAKLWGTDANVPYGHSGWFGRGGKVHLAYFSTAGESYYLRAITELSSPTGGKYLNTGCIMSETTSSYLMMGCRVSSPAGTKGVCETAVNTSGGFSYSNIGVYPNCTNGSFNYYCIPLGAV